MKACMACNVKYDESEFMDPRKTKPKRYCRACRARSSKVAKQAAAKAREFGDGKSYDSRDRWVMSIGFKNYREYLGSELWKAVRRAVFTTKGKTCSTCGQDATELHHTRYHRNDLLGKVLKHIFPICKDCHEAVERDGSQKTTMHRARAKFRRRQKWFRRR